MPEPPESPPPTSMKSLPLFSSRFLLAAVATLGLAPGVSAQADTVSLTFAWPAGLVADVTAESSVTVESMMGNQMENSEFTFELVMLAHSDGLSIASRNFNFGGDEPATPEERFAQSMQGKRPTLVVSSSGEFVGLEGVDQITTAVTAALDSMAGPGGDAIGALFGNMDEDFWTSQATADWNTRVGLWAGREFRLGEVVTVRGDQRFPMFGSESLPVTWALEYRGVAACNADDAGDSCVTLAVRTTPDGDALAEAMRGFMAEMLSEMGPAGMQIPFEVDEVSVESEMVMIVEPHTLLPHSLTTEMTTSQAISIMGTTQTTTNRNTERMTYVYRR